MSFVKSWQRLNKREREKQKSGYKKFLRKIATGIAGLGFLATCNMAAGSDITPIDAFDAGTNPGGSTSVSQDGTKFDIYSHKTVGTNAFNAFSQFNLDSGHNANLHLPGGTDNLINFVKSEITINGTLNAIKDNKIGGNLFFLSSQGLVVGSGGVINCGAFFAITPTEDFMNNFVSGDHLIVEGKTAEINMITGRKFVNHNQVIAGEGIPINNDASIIINGEINAIDNISLTSADVAANFGSNLKTGVTDFSSVVNTSDLPVGCQVNGLSMSSGDDGNIELVAIADNKSALSGVSGFIADEFTSFTKAEANGKVYVNGTVEAKRDAVFEAVAVNGELNEIDENFHEYGETRTLEKYGSTKFVSKITSTVEFGSTADVDAKRNLVVNAISRNFYSPSSVNLLDLGLGILGMTTPFNLGAEVAVEDSKAEIIVNSGANLHASEDVKITADSETDVSVGASTALAKIKKTGGGISVGAVYADVNSEANITIEGAITAGENGVPDKGNIEINAISKNNLELTGATKTANDNAFIAFATVVAKGSNNAKVTIDSGSTISSENDVSISAKAISDISTEAVAQTGNSSKFGVAVNVTQFQSNADVEILADINAKNDININAENRFLQYRSIANSTIGYTLIAQAIANAESNLVSKLFSMSNFTEKFTDNLGASQGSKFKAAGAIHFDKSTNNSSVTIGGDVKIEAGNEVDIAANSVIEDYCIQTDSKAVSKIDNPEGAQVGASAAVMSIDLEQRALIEVEDSTRTSDISNAAITGKKVTIATLTKVEYNRIERMIQAVQDAWATLQGNVSAETWNGYLADFKAKWDIVTDRFAALGSDEVTGEENIKVFFDALSALPAIPSEILDLITGGTAIVSSAAQVVTNAADFLFYQNYLNMYVSSAIKGANDSTASTIGLSGAFAFNDFKGESEVLIGRNAFIETTGATSDTSISITADTDIENISGAGHLLPSTGAKSFGGTFLSQDFFSNAEIYVAEGTSLITNGKDAELYSNNKLKTTAIGVSSAIANYGIEGMVSRQEGQSTAKVFFDDEAILYAKNATFRATDNTDILNIGGAVMVNSGVGAGVGMAITDYTKENVVKIGDIDDEFQDRKDELFDEDPDSTTNSEMNRSDGKVAVTDNINAETKSTGDSTSVGVAGGVTKNDDSGDDGFVSRLTNKLDGGVVKVKNTIDSLGSKFGNKITDTNSKTGASGSHANPDFSLTAAGSLGVNFIKNTTKVDISGANLELGSVADSNLNATAINSSENKAWAGAAGIMFQTAKLESSQGAKTVGIAGAIGINSIENNTEAIVENNTINYADKVQVFAVDGGQDLAMGLGLQVSANNGNAEGAFTIGSSVSVTNVDNIITARMKNNTVNGTVGEKTDLNVAAYEGDRTITGGAIITVGQEKGAFGAAVNVINVNNTTEASIENGTYSNIGDVTVSAMQALTQLNGALTVGAIFGTPDTCTIMGTMIYNQTDNIAHAKIDGANFSTNGSVAVNTRDYKHGDAAVSDFEALLDPLDEDVDEFVSTSGEDYYNIDTSNDVDGTNEPLANQEIDGSLIVSGGLVVTASDVPLGASVVINDLSNDFKSEIINSTITADQIDANASVNSKLISVAAGVAVSLGNGGAAGSFVFNDINNLVNAGFLSSDLTGDQIRSQARNGADITGISGIISAGAGNAAIGLAAGYNNITNDTNAYSLATHITGADNNTSELLVEATNNSDLLNISASFGISQKVGIGGSISVNEITDNTIARVDNSYTDEDNNEIVLSDMSLTNLVKADINSSDDARLLSLAGNVAGGGTCGLGGSVSHSNIDGETSAYLYDATISAKEIDVETTNESEIFSWAAGIGGAGNLAAQGAVANANLNRTVKSQLDDVAINNPLTQLFVNSYSKGSSDTNATVANGAGQAAIGAGIAVNRITDEISSEIHDSNLNIYDLYMRSTSEQEIGATGVAGSAGGSAGISGAVGYNRIRTTNSTFVKDSSIDAGNNLGVVAQTDDRLLNYGGLLSLGGTAGIGAAFSGNTIEGDTTAYIENSTVSAKGLVGQVNTHSQLDDESMNDAFIDDQTLNLEYKLSDQREDNGKAGIVVDSSATHTFKSFVANAAGGGTVGLAGTVGVNAIEGETSAYIVDSTLNPDADNGDVTVNAADFTNYSSYIGSVGGAGTVGIGMAVNTNKTDRNTSAHIDNAAPTSKAKNLTVAATGKQGISSIAAGIGVSGTAGIAGTVSTTDFSGKTEAKVENSNISVDSIGIDATQFARSKVNNSTAGISYVGVGGSVAVGTDKHEVSAIVDNSNIGFNSNGSGEFSVQADNYTDFNTVAEAVGAGVVGAAGNVSVNYVENTVSTKVNNSNIGASDYRALNIDIEAENDLNLNSDVGSVGAGAVGAGCSVSVNTVDGKVRTEVDGSNLYAVNDIIVSADENRTVDQTSFTVTAGGGAASLNVMNLAVGELLSSSDDDGNQEISDAIDSAEEVNAHTVDDDNDVMTDEEQANMNGVGGELTSSEAGKSATTVAVGDIFSGNGTTIDSSTGNVEITASEDTNTTMTGGAAAAGGAAAGASIATSKTNRNLGVTVHDVDITAAGNIDIAAQVTGDANLEMYQGSAGAFAAGTAAFGKVETTGNAVGAISDSSFNSSGNINIESSDSSNADAVSYGLTAGMISAGFINTGIDNSGSTKINLNNNTLNADQNIVIKTTKDNEVSAKSVGGSVGIFGSGIGVHSYIDDNSDSAITMTGINSNFSANDISITAENTPQIDSEATTVALAYLNSAGVSVATANLSGKSVVDISGGNSFNAPSVNFNGIYDGDSDTKVLGISGGMATSFGYNRSESTNNATVNVFVGNNDYSSNTDLVVNGQNIVDQSADTSGLNIGGVISSGNNKAKLTSETETIVRLTGNDADFVNLNSIDVKADSSSIHSLDADGNGGGLVSVDGLSAYAISDITSTTEAYISGKWDVDNTVELFATHYDKVKISADSSKGSLVGYSGTKAENIIDSTTKAVFDDNSKIISKDDVDFAAINTIGYNNEDGDPKYAADGGGYGGIVVNGAKAIADITSYTLAKVGANAELASDGNITGDARTEATVRNRSRTTGAGFVANPLASNETTLDIDNNALTSSGSKLKNTSASKDISIAASEDLDITASSDSDMQGGLGGAANADTEFDTTKENSVKIYGDLESKHDINLYADANSSGKINVYDISATAYAYNKHSAVAIANADLDSSTEQTNEIFIGSDADVSSVRHIHIGATPGREKMTEEAGEYTWASDETTGGYSSTSSGQRSKNVTGTNKIEIYGDLVAGSQNKVHMTLDGIVDIEGKAENSSLEPTVTSTIQEYSDQLILDKQDYANALFKRYQEVTDLAAEYSGTDAGVGYQAEKERLLDEMEKYGLYDSDNDVLSSGLTIQYVELPDMVSSGGNVVINTEDVSGNGTIKAQGSPEIIINNNTNLYTKINDLTIEDYGGEIIYNDVSLGDTADDRLPTLSYVETNDSSNALISVNQNWSGPVQVKDDNNVIQNLTPLTTIEINGHLDNPLGRVEVNNLKGDIIIQGKTANDSASISGAEIVLTASSGSISQGFTEGIVNIGGTPEDVYSTYASDEEDDIDGHETSTTVKKTINNDINEGLQHGVWIAGGSVFINASDINVNGLIQSGYSKYEVTLSSTAQTKINAFDANYNGENITPDILNSKYKINSGGAKFDPGDDNYKYEVQAFYNPQTKQIILEDIDPQGGRYTLPGAFPAPAMVELSQQMVLQTLT